MVTVDETLLSDKPVTKQLFISTWPMVTIWAVISLCNMPPMWDRYGRQIGWSYRINMQPIWKAYIVAIWNKYGTHVETIWNTHMETIWAVGCKPHPRPHAAHMGAIWLCYWESCMYSQARANSWNCRLSSETPHHQKQLETELTVGSGHFSNPEIEGTARHS